MADRDDVPDIDWEEPLESSQPLPQRMPSDHFRPTIPAPKVPLPPAAHQPKPPPRPSVGRIAVAPAPPPPLHDPSAAFPPPPKVPDASGRKPPPPRDLGPPPPPPPAEPPPPSTLRRSVSPPSMRPGVARYTYRPKRPMSRPGEPTVLLVGAPDSLFAAIEPALARYRVHVERCTTEDASDAVLGLAPDLVVLAGDAAQDAGHHILKSLALSPESAVVPVALLGESTELDTRLRAFRHGAAAVIPRTASMDEMAERIAKLAREIPERETESLGDVGEATLQDLVEALGKELRTGILSVRTTGSDAQAVRIVLGGGRALTDTIDDFVTRVREHVVSAEPLQYEFDERAAGTVQLLGSTTGEKSGEQIDVKGLRVVLADDDAARADEIAQELRGHGVDVVVTDLDPSEVRFHRLRTMDPTVLLIGEEQAQGAGYDLMRRMRRDTRLRWASLLVVRWHEVWTEQSEVPAVDRILGTMSALAEPERALAQRAESRVAFDTRMEITGAARMLRALALSSKPVRVTVQSPRVRVRLDVSEGLVVGATGETLVDEHMELTGPSALAALMAVSSGRVHVEPTEQPATANVMATPDVALNMADAEPPPIPPSMPIPAAVERRRSERPVAAVPRRVERSAKPTAPVVWVAAGVLGAGLVAAAVLVFAVLPSRKAPVANVAATKAAPLPPPAVSTPQPAPSARPTASAAPPAPPAPPKAVEQLPASANALTEAPTCEGLLGPLKPIPGVYPGAAYDKLRDARKALGNGNLDIAQGHLCHALRFDPQNPDVAANMARVLLLRRDPKAALGFARDAVKLKPDDKNNQLLMGDALAQAGDMSRARDPLLLGFDIPPNDDAVRLKVAKSQIAVGEQSAAKQDHVASERAFRRAVALDPKNAIATAGVASAMLEQGHAEAAVQWARQATALDPRSAAAEIALGDALAKSGDKSGAAAAWKKAAELDPNDPVARTRALTLD
jgi:Flp pilus assembly protein TadD/DNA-binding response OmpR family regulator